MLKVLLLGWGALILLGIAGIPLAFATPGYRELGIMLLVGVPVAVVANVGIYKSRIDEFTKSQLALAITLGGLLALVFTAPTVYAAIVWLNENTSTALIIVVLVARPVLRPLVEMILDKFIQCFQRCALEQELGKEKTDSSKLEDLSKTTALAEGLYSGWVTGMALTKVLTQTDLNDAEQSMLIGLLVVVLVPTICSIHPHQRSLRAFVKKERVARNS